MPTDEIDYEALARVAYEAYDDIGQPFSKTMETVARAVVAALTDQGFVLVSRESLGRFLAYIGHEDDALTWGNRPSPPGDETIMAYRDLLARINAARPNDLTGASLAVFTEEEVATLDAAVTPTHLAPDDGGEEDTHDH